MVDLKETELVDKHSELFNGLQPLTSSVEPSLMVTEMANFLLPTTTPASDVMSTPEAQVMEEGSLSIVESKNMLEQLREIVVFVGPTLGIWLSGLIVSLIDTSVVGNNNALELAALDRELFMRSSLLHLRVPFCGHF